jgi:hypothetical protein
MANAMIYGQYAPQPRSFQDYSNEIERGRFLQGQNAIQQAAMADRQQQQAAAQQKQNALASLLSGATSEQDATDRLLNSGNPDFIGMGQGLRQKREEADKARAETRNKDADFQTKVLGGYRDAMKTAQGPEDGAALLQLLISDERLKGHPASQVPLQAALQQMQTFPGGFAEWRNSFVLDADKYISEKRMAANDAVQAANTIRGQDITAATARRGQDISASTTRRGQDMTDARAREANQAGGAAAGAPKPSAAQERADLEKAKAGRQGEQMMAAIEQARQLLGKNPTASGVGAAVDATGRFFGATSESAKTAAKLETLSGWMVANVPRMEGPQSNFDVENYKTMAAKVGDRTTPIAERLAALSTLEELHRRYADINDTPLPKAPSSAVDTGAGVPAIKFLGFE